MKDNKQLSGLEAYLTENPVSSYALLGGLKSILIKPPERAAVEQEIAKTIAAGYGLGNIGDVSRVKTNDTFSSSLQGAMAGYIQKRNDDFNKKILDAATKKETFRKPANVKAAAVDYPIQANPNEELIRPELNKEIHDYVTQRDFSNGGLYPEKYAADVPQQLMDITTGSLQDHTLGSGGFTNYIANMEAERKRKLNSLPQQRILGAGHGQY